VAFAIAITDGDFSKLTSISQAQVEGLTSLEGSFITSDIL